MTVEEIKQYRLTHSVPIFKEFYRWLQRSSRDQTVLPRSLFGKAVNYALNEFSGLLGILRNGAIRIDNNAAERVMRALVLGKKLYVLRRTCWRGKSGTNILDNSILQNEQNRPIRISCRCSKQVYGLQSSQAL